MLRHHLDESAFETVTDESAYWLGFLMTDGNVHYPNNRQPRITLVLAEHDKDHIENFKTFLTSTHTIFYKRPRRMNRHFWRGCMDGDGTVGFASGNGGRNKYAFAALYGSANLCAQFAKFVSYELNISVNVCAKTENLSITRYRCTKAEKVINLLYADCSTVLARKARIAQSMLTEGG
jgi:hypothetical protein